MSRLLRLLAGVLALCAMLPTGAHAAANLETGIADDRLLLGGGEKAAQTVAAWKALGVDDVRVFVRWVAVAPGSASRTVPAGFDAADPDDPQYTWNYLDDAIALLRANGITPILTVTGSGPLWSSQDPARGNPRYKPDPVKFGQFAGAVAKRYGSAVDRYIVWNEPNIPAWLQPQFACTGSGARKRCTPAAPQVYRSLYVAGSAAIHAADPGAQVLMGALAPRGSNPTSTNAKVRPLAFLRALGCVTRSYRRDRTGACRTAKPFRADAIAYHPHSVLMSPSQHAPLADEAAIDDLPRLESAIDRTAAHGIFKPSHGARFSLYLTEYGYQTNPPDPISGVSTTRQAAWTQQAEYIAWRDPRVKAIVQYEYQDEPTKSNTDQTDPFASWQSGLLFANGRPKPLLAAFPNPFFVDVRPRARLARFWGQVRPGTVHQVTLQKRTGGGAWTPVRSFTTTAYGVWTAQLPVTAAADYRYSYEGVDADGAATMVDSAIQSVKPLR